MGASKIGDIKELSEIALPNYALITNIGKAHLEGFGNCSNTGACEVECPKGISLDNIARMNRELMKASFNK